jgi:hypothetical protein
MNNCHEYDLYFFDYIDDLLSLNKRNEYKSHLITCGFCKLQYESHIEYKKMTCELSKQYHSTTDIKTRLLNKIENEKNEQKRDKLLDQIGLISIKEISDIFELDELAERKIIEHQYVVRIMKDFYIKKENLNELITNLFSEIGEDKKLNVSGLFRYDGIGSDFFNDYLLARNNINK